MNEVKHPSLMTLNSALMSVCLLSALVLGQVSAPRKVKDVEPIYPRESLQAGDEGVVLLELNITARGTVREAQILWSGCQRLDRAALTAVRKWRYEQLRVNGKPAPFKVVASVPFRLPAPLKSRAGRVGACKWAEPPKPVTQK
jgi:TonB family protein